MAWTGRRDSDPRLQRWQRCALPLSYFRLVLPIGFEPILVTGLSRLRPPLRQGSMEPIKRIALLLSRYDGEVLLLD
jgi:hypothetical protein